MKIYTKKGDKGLTTLYREKEVPKSDDRIELIGLLDELNSSLGLALSFIRQAAEEVWRLQYYRDIQKAQKDLFEIGAVLAGAEAKPGWLTQTTAHLESLIDEVDALNAPLTNFILPGGVPSASALHLARTVCRRVEREFVSYYNQLNWSGYLTTDESLPFGFVGDVIAYLNRLGDYLFVVARKENGTAEILWIRE
jgi:cob(I)alamin adenosyltransferase